MWLTRNTAGSAEGGLVWNKPGDVVEVPDEVGEQLLAIPGGGFAEVARPDSAPAAPADEGEAGDGETDKTARRTSRARKTPVAE